MTNGEMRRAGGRPPVITPELIARARELSSEGKTLAAIAAELGCSPRTVSRMLAMGEANGGQT